SRASAITSWPALVSASVSRRPMKPVAPVISTHCLSGSALTSSAALPKTSRCARRAAKKSRRPNTITPAAASGASRLPMPYQTGAIAVRWLAHEQREDGAIIDGQQRVGDALARRKLSTQVLLDEVDKCDDDFCRQHGNDQHRPDA